MAENYEQSLNELESMPDTIDEQVRSLSPDQWESKVWGAEGGWNRRQLLAHLATINLRQLTRVRVAAGLPDPEEERAQSLRLGIDDWNHGQVDALSSANVEELLRELRANRRALVDLARSLTPDQRAQIRIARGDQTMTLEEWAPFVLQHDRTHLAEIVA